jgi:hypothetical protein
VKKRSAFRPDVATGVLAALLLTAVSWVACGRELPEPESPGARLYTRYCSGEGCHGPIPPRRGGKRYWDMQYARMLPLMRKEGWKLPSRAETEEILAYLHRHARGTQKEK